jgi:hypothetical protein
VAVCVWSSGAVPLTAARGMLVTLDSTFAAIRLQDSASERAFKTQTFSGTAQMERYDHPGRSSTSAPLRRNRRLPPSPARSPYGIDTVFVEHVKSVDRVRAANYSEATGGPARVKRSRSR